MNEREAHKLALDLLEIDDVFPIDATTYVDRDFNQSMPLSGIRFQHKFAPTPDILVQKRVTSEGGEIFIVRFLVTGAIRALKADTPSEIPGDALDDNFFARLTATFAVDYKAVREIKPDMDETDKQVIVSFVRQAVFHAYPVWRAHVLNMCGQMRLPRMVVPIMKPEAAAVPLGESSTSPADVGNE